MELTPRNLAMSLAACLAGGLLLGFAASIGPSIGATDSGPGAAGAGPGYSQAELGDDHVSYPTREFTLATPSTAPNPSLAHQTTPAPAATSATASTPPSPVQTTTRVAAQGTTATGSRDLTHPNPTRTTTARHPSPPPQQAPRPPAATPAAQRSRPQPLHDWKPPPLGVGAIDISAPTLSSGVRAHATVLCSPSTACTAAGTSLTISPEATHVSVTWSASSVRQWRGWSVTTSYSPRSTG